MSRAPLGVRTRYTILILGLGNIGRISAQTRALAPVVQEAIKPIYESLSDDDLLRRCLGGNTQNSNERLNACIWRMADFLNWAGAELKNYWTNLDALFFKLKRIKFIGAWTTFSHFYGELIFFKLLESVKNIVKNDNFFRLAAILLIFDIFTWKWSKLQIISSSFMCRI